MLKKQETQGYSKEVVMFMRSTGLGRTLLTAKVANIEATTVVPSTLEESKEGAIETTRMLLVNQVLYPVHCTVRAFIDPSDLRKAVGAETLLAFRQESVAAMTLRWQKKLEEGLEKKGHSFQRKTDRLMRRDGDRGGCSFPSGTV